MWKSRDGERVGNALNAESTKIRRGRAGSRGPLWGFVLFVDESREGGCATRDHELGGLVCGEVFRSGGLRQTRLA